jgi:hypothetical protein
MMTSHSTPNRQGYFHGSPAPLPNAAFPGLRSALEMLNSDGHPLFWERKGSSRCFLFEQFCLVLWGLCDYVPQFDMVGFPT